MTGNAAALTREIQILARIEPVLYDRYFAHDEALHQLWPLLRVQLGFENFNHARSQGAADGDAAAPAGLAGRVRSLAARWLAGSRELVVDRGHRSTLDRADLFFSTYSTSRYCRNARGEHVDAFVTPLFRWSRELDPGLAIEIEEYPIGGEFRVPRDLPTTYSGLSHLRTSLGAGLARDGIEPELEAFLADVRRLVAGADGVCASLQERPMRRTLAAYRLFEAHYLRRLGRLRPRAVFVVTYYSLHAMAMIAAARRLGIMTVDVQHGVQGREHMAYGQWPAPPAGGYRLLPHVFWCWSPSDVANIAGWAGACHEAVEGGNVWSRYVAENPADFPGQAGLAGRVSASGRRFRVAVTLSPGAPGFLAQLRDAMLSPLTQDVYWMVRLHPGMFSDEDEVQAALEPCRAFCDVALSSRVALPVLLELADLHLTEFSSVILEAEQAGVPSLSTVSELDYFAEQQQAGTLVLRAPGEPVAAAVRRCLDREGAPHAGANAAPPADPRRVLRALLQRAGVLA